MPEGETGFFKSLRYYSLGLSLSILLIFGALYCYFLFNFNLVKNFFTFFELTPGIKFFLAVKIERIIIQSTLTDIVLIFAGIFGFFYLMWVIENKGFMVFEGYDIYQKHFQTAFYILALFNFIILFPLFIFLINVGNRIKEAALIVTLYLVSFAVAQWFRKFAELIRNYDELLIFFESIKNPLDIFNIFSDGKTSLKFLIVTRTFFSRSLLLLMFLVFFYSIEWNFNLLTIIYIILVFLAWYFILCSVTKVPFSLVNIALNTGENFTRVFITEESSNEYIVTLHSGNLQRKVMKNTVKFIELADSSNNLVERANVK